MKFKVGDIVYNKPNTISNQKNKGIVTFVIEDQDIIVVDWENYGVESYYSKEFLATASPPASNTNGSASSNNRGYTITSTSTQSSSSPPSVFGPYPVMDESATFVQDKIHILGCDCGGKKTYGVISKETCAHWCQTQSLGGSSGGCL